VLPLTKNRLLALGAVARLAAEGKITVAEPPDWKKLSAELDKASEDLERLRAANPAQFELCVSRLVVIAVKTMLAAVRH